MYYTTDTQIEVVVPVIDLKKDLKKGKFGTVTGVVELFYPCWFFQIHNYLKRYKLRDRVVDLFIVIDGCSGHPMMLDGRPNFFSREAAPESVMAHVITVEEAKEKAADFSSRYIFRKFSVAHPIRKEFAEEKCIYKIVYGLLTKDITTKNELILVDSITSDKSTMEIDGETARDLHRKRKEIV
jgi:hypothetical protein